MSLDRPAGTLSGGEAQRTKTIRHPGSSLTDLSYIFGESTVGLHPHDIQRMNTLLLQFRDKGNTVLVVEHKPETIAIADHFVDLGPRAGVNSGRIQFTGTIEPANRRTGEPWNRRTVEPSNRGTGEPVLASDTLTGKHFNDRAVLAPPLLTPTGSSTSVRMSATTAARSCSRARPPRS